jgi:hypothetical protein
MGRHSRGKLRERYILTDGAGAGKRARLNGLPRPSGWWWKDGSRMGAGCSMSLTAMHSTTTWKAEAGTPSRWNTLRALRLLDWDSALD